jgi:hypothetical protein
MDIHIRRVKNTPYKLVFNGSDIVGVFENNQFISRSNMNEKLKHVAAQFHADTLLDRLESCDG